MGELLYELPSVPGVCPREPLLNDSNGFDGQGEVRGDGEHLFIGDRTA